MLRLPFLLWLALVWSPFAGGCKDIFIHLSGASEQEFTEQVELSQRQPVNRIPWLTAELEPRFLVSHPSDLQNMAETVNCCGMTVDQTRNLLADLLKDGAISVQDYLNRSFALADGGAAPLIRRNCLHTVQTYLHSLYTSLPSSRNREVVDHFLVRIAPSDLRWGDVLVLRGETDVEHVIINLGNGIVFHKIGGIGPARIDPLTTALGLYHKKDLDQVEIWRKREGDPREILATFSPEPPRRRFWWLGL